MQVKKFEAKSMKDALELVKAHLGPEAIILSAKDTHRGFGLIGEKSVEVTAAVSDDTLRRKKIAETKLHEEARAQFHRSPAARQKEFIHKVFASPVTPAPAPAPKAVVTVGRTVDRGTRYIDIEDEQQAPPRSARVSAAAAAAANVAKTFGAPPAQLAVRQAKAQGPLNKNPQILALEGQVRELKSLIEKFQSMPSLPMSMHPGAEQGLPFEVSALYKRLCAKGVDAQLAAAMLRQLAREFKPEFLADVDLQDAWLARHLASRVSVTAEPTAARHHIFLGATGQGKTTTLVKFASHLMLNERRTIAIVSLDTLKLGAADQLRLYAQILNVPFAVLREPGEWAVAERKLARVQHVLVDAPGLRLDSPEELAWLRDRLPPLTGGRANHFVQSSLATVDESVADRYRTLGFDDVIFTRLDESARRGTLLNFHERFKVPFHSFANGTGIPEDFELARPEHVCDLMFKTTKENPK